jgi:hypothetical protein
MMLVSARHPEGTALTGAYKTGSFVRSIALRSPCSVQALGGHPWPPVERMRSTHGRIHGVLAMRIPPGVP